MTWHMGEWGSSDLRNNFNDRWGVVDVARRGWYVDNEKPIIQIRCCEPVWVYDTSCYEISRILSMAAGAYCHPSRMMLRRSLRRGSSEVNHSRKVFHRTQVPNDVFLRQWKCERLQQDAHQDFYICDWTSAVSNGNMPQILTHLKLRELETAVFILDQSKHIRRMSQSSHAGPVPAQECHPATPIHQL